MNSRSNSSVIVFDFDGVVCDSTYECMVTSWNAWQKWCMKADIRTDLSLFSEKERLSFSRLRPRVRGAGEYYVIQRAINEGLIISNQIIYDDLVYKWGGEIKIFKEIFYEMRRQFRESNLLEWINLHIVYKDVINVMKALSKSDQLYIATLKDGLSVRLILKHFGVSICDGKLLDESMISSKLEALDMISRNFDIRKSDIIFIDDNVTHLVDPLMHGYAVYLTTWGNTLMEYQNLAAEKGINILSSTSELILLRNAGIIPR